MNEFNANTEEIKLSIDDGLDMHDQTIYVLRKTGHYDILYKEQNEWPNLKMRIQWDDKFRKML